MKGFDFSKFKKVSSDKKSTVLKHVDGHELKIAHEGLSPKMRQELSKLPMHNAKHFDDGGEVDNYSSSTTPVSQPPLTQADPGAQKLASSGSSGGGGMSSMMKMLPMLAAAAAKGGEVKHFDDGGNVSSSVQPDQDSQPQSDSDKLAQASQQIQQGMQDQQPAPAPSIQDKWDATYDKTLQSLRNQNYSHYDDAELQKQAQTLTANQLGAAKDAQDAQAQKMNSVTNQDAALSKQMQDSGYQQDLKRVTDVNAQRSKLGLAPIPLPADPNAPARLPAPTGLQEATSVDVDNQSPASITDNSQSPAQQPSPIMPKIAQPIAASTPEQSIQDYKNVVQNNMLQENKAWEDDLVNGHVTPETYHDLFAKKDTLGKIGTIFGMLVSGAGSGLSHQPNALLSMMDHQIDNDLKAQVQSKNNANNFNTLTQQHEMQKVQQGLIGIQTQQAQFNLNKMRMNSAALHSLVQTVNKTDPNTPQGQQARQQLGMIYNSVQGENYSLADKAAAAEAYYKLGSMGTNSNNPTSPVNYGKFNQLERNSQMKLPGAPSEKDLSDMTTEAKSLDEASALQKDFNQTFQELDQKFLAGKLSPNDRASAVDSLKGKMAKIAEGRFSAQSSELINAMLPQAGDWGATRANKQERDQRFFDILRAGTPTLQRFQVLNPTSQQQSSSKQSSIPDGATGTYKGMPVVRQNGKWVRK